MNKILKGKTAIITGANQGLGLAISKLFISAGANLMICARDEVLLNDAYLSLKTSLGDKQFLDAKKIDVSSPMDCKYLVEYTLKNFGGCHILVNNAGIYGPKGDVDVVDWSAWIKAIEVNVYGSVLMCRELVPHFKQQQYGKIIQLSGGGATNPLPKLSAYATSKAAIVRFSETLAEELRAYSIDVNAIAPGALNTRLLNEILLAGPELVGKDFYEKSLKQKQDGGVPVNLAAELALFLASPLSDGLSGKLISAVWDNWREWPNHIDELLQTDAYTLRRIAGRDRDMDWGDK